ncbi:uncharacterized protein DS421_16g567950 [Arachis hypogaea]|nr:uncharacterized protein DS421_16g567950 [Arachis hypogaea]
MHIHIHWRPYWCPPTIVVVAVVLFNHHFFQNYSDAVVFFCYAMLSACWFLINSGKGNSLSWF